MQVSSLPAPAVSFERLLNREVERKRLDLIFFLHVPKTGGHSVCALLRQNHLRQIDLDPGVNEFVPLLDEQTLFDLHERGQGQLGHFMSGHYRLDHAIFRRVPIPYVTISMLRHPVEQILSHYNFTLRRTRAPWHEEAVNGRISFLEYAQKIHSTVGAQYRFFDDTGRGTFMPSGSATPQRCLDNLLSKISFYGFTDRFDEFAIMLG